jgi:hypothetical protein
MKEPTANDVDMLTVCWLCEQRRGDNVGGKIEPGG